MQSNLNAVSDLSYGVVVIPQGSYLGWVISGTFVGTTHLEKSLDSGVTWSTIDIRTAPATGDVLAAAFTFYRFRCSAYTSGTIAVDLYQTAGPTTHRRMVPFAVDYVWDFATHGGAIGSVVLTPSRVIPAGTVLFSFLQVTLVAITGAGTLGLGYTDEGGNFGIQAGTQDAAIATNLVTDGPLYIVTGTNDVKVDIASNTITAGRVMWTLIGLTPEL